MSKNNEVRIDEKQQQKDLFVQNETHCCLCDEPLDFTHAVDFSENKVAEFATCPCCHIELRTRESTLH